MTLAAGTRLGPYQILAAIGAGGMGEVYRARDTRLGRDVAIKVLPDAFLLDAERVARFEREARVLASLNHPHIASIYGFEQTAQLRGIVLELVEGPTLADRLTAGAIPVAGGVGYCAPNRRCARRRAREGDHPSRSQAGQHQGRPRRDCESARLRPGEDRRRTTASVDLSQSPTMAIGGTRAGVILGTAAYMSPEQARGKPIGQTHRHLVVRLRAVRDADGPDGVCRRNRLRLDRGNPRPRPGLGTIARGNIGSREANTPTMSRTGSTRASARHGGCASRARSGAR